MVSKKVKNTQTFLNWENQTWYWEMLVFFRLGMGPLEMHRKSPGEGGGGVLATFF